MRNKIYLQLMLTASFEETCIANAIQFEEKSFKTNTLSTMQEILSELSSKIITKAQDKKWFNDTVSSFRNALNTGEKPQAWLAKQLEQYGYYEMSQAFQREVNYHYNCMNFAFDFLEMRSDPYFLTVNNRLSDNLYKQFPSISVVSPEKLQWGDIILYQGVTGLAHIALYLATIDNKVYTLSKLGKGHNVFINSVDIFPESYKSFDCIATRLDLKPSVKAKFVQAKHEFLASISHKKLSLPESKQASTKPSRKLIPDDEIGLIKLEHEQQTELKNCIYITSNTTLSEEEYKNASDEFKILIATPREAKQPIYIMPEFDAEGQLHPRLQGLITAIKKGLPYHQFITENYGTIWPMLLRLYYGLNCGFKISIEQLHSMMKVSYWRSTGLNIENAPITLADEKTLSPVGNLFVNYALFKSGEIEGSNPFLSKIYKPEVPIGERHVLVVHLSIEYFRMAMVDALTRMETQPDGFNHAMILLKSHDVVENVPQAGAFSEAEISRYCKMNGATMYAALLGLSSRYYRIFFLNRKPVLLLPSQTMLQSYCNVLNPERKLEVIHRLGAFNLDIMEKCSDQNGRVINLYAPGVPGPNFAHGKVVFPYANLEHDDYHVLNEGTLSPKIYQQILRAKTILRQFYQDDSGITTEIFRSIDRERLLELKEQVRFYELMRYLFSHDIQNYAAPIKISSVILLVDMILSPKHWPYFASQEQKFIDLLLPFKSAKNAEADLVIKMTQQFAAKTKDPTFIAVLLLCHYYLNDPAFCQILLDAQFKSPHCAMHKWKKGEEGFLLPVLIRNGEEYSFEKIAKLTSSTRATLWMNAKIPTPNEEKLTLLNSSLSNHMNDPLFLVTNYKDSSGSFHKKQNQIAALCGTIVEEIPTENSVKIRVKSDSLKREIREILELDRFKIKFPTGQGCERSTYLRSAGVTVEHTLELDTYIITFPKSLRLLVDNVKDHWNEKTAMPSAITPDTVLRL